MNLPSTDSRDCIRCALCVMDCPTFSITADETRTMKGRRLALQAGRPIEAVAGTMADCIACGLCDAVCPRDLNNSELVLELNRVAHAGSRTNAGAETMRDALAKTGNPFGVAESPVTPRKGGRTLLWLGCAMRAKTPRLIPPLLRFLEALDLDVTISEETGCCGWPLLRAGDTEGADALFSGWAHLAAGYERIVTPCAMCADHLRRNSVRVPVLHPLDLLGGLSEPLLLGPGDWLQLPSHIVNRYPDQALPRVRSLAAATGATPSLNLMGYTQDLGEDVPNFHGPIAAKALETLALRPDRPKRIVTFCPMTQVVMDAHPKWPSVNLVECLPPG